MLEIQGGWTTFPRIIPLMSLRPGWNWDPKLLSTVIFPRLRVMGQGGIRRSGPWVSHPQLSPADGLVTWRPLRAPLSLPFKALSNCRLALLLPMYGHCSRPMGHTTTSLASDCFNLSKAQLLSLQSIKFPPFYGAIAKTRESHIRLNIDYLMDFLCGYWKLAMKWDSSM